MAEDLRHEDDRRQPGRAEKALMVVSTLVTLTLFGYLVHQGIEAPDGARPEASVVAVEPMGDSLRVDVRVENEGSVGLISVTLEVDCGEPPPQVTFENVPASGMREASLSCPRGATDPHATVVSFEAA